MLGITGSAGLLAGLSTEPSTRQLAATAGLGVGLLGGYAVAPWFDAPPDVVFGAASGGVILGATGLGLGTLLASVDEETGERDVVVVRTATFVGTAAGLGVGAWLGQRNPDIVDQGDVLFTSFVAGWMTWQAAGWNLYARRTRGPSRSDGLYILVPAVVTGAVGASTPYVDVPISYSLTAASTGLWGGYVAGSMAEVTRTSDTLDGRVLRAALHGSNLGIAAGTALTLPPFRGSPLVIGMANAGGVTCGASFALVASAAGATPREALGWSVLGSGLGFVGGTAAGLVTHRKGGTREIAWSSPLRVPGTWSLSPATFEGDDGSMLYGARVGVHGW